MRQMIEEPRGFRAIYDPMVYRERQKESFADRQPVLDHERPRLDSADRQNAALWRNDDRLELIHAVGPEVAYGEAAARQIFRSALPLSRARYKRLPFARQSRKRERVHRAQHWRDQSFGRLHGQADVYALKRHHAGLAPLRIHGWKSAQSQRQRFQQQVGHRDAHAYVGLYLRDHLLT